MANISKIKLPSGVTYDVVDEKSGYITSASLPTKTSDLTNDSGYITNSSLNNYLEKSYTGSNQTGSISWNTYDNNNIYLFTQVDNTNEDAHSYIGIDSSTIGLGTIYNGDEDSFTGEVSVSSESVNIGFSNDAGVGDTSYYLTIDKYNGYHFRSINNHDYYHIYMPKNKSGTIALTSDIPTETTVSGWGFTKNTGTLTGVTFAGTSMSVSSGVASITQANARTALGLATVATSGSYNDLTNKPTIPVNTDEKVKVSALTSGTSYYPVLAEAANTDSRQIDSTLNGFKYQSTAGTTSTVGTAMLILGNSTASGTANNETGVLRIYGTKAKYHDLRAVDGYPTWDRTVYFPRYANNMYLTCTSNMSAVGGATTAPVYVDDTGCINAVTSIPYSLLTGTPTIPTIRLNNNSTTSPAFYAPTGAGSSGQYLKSNGSGAPSWANFPTIPTKTSELTNDSGFVKTDTNTTYTLSNALSSHKFTHTLTAGGSGSGTSTATITFAAGSNVTLTDDTTNKKITIAATDTKYSAGTGLSLSGTTFNISIVPIANGGTGKTTAADAINVLLNGLPAWTATPTDSTYFIRQDTGGAASYGKATFSTLWTYINGKVALNYLPLTGGSVTGPVTFNDSITVDDATVGSLVVNGSASFTNNITVGGELTVGGSNVIATDISDKLTLGGAWTQLIKVVYELCGMVFYYVEAKPSSYNANYQYTIATFASGYRPSTNAVGQGYTTDGGFAPKSVVSVLAQTDGALKVNASNNTGAYFFASGWFKI